MELLELKAVGPVGVVDGVVGAVGVVETSARRGGLLVGFGDVRFDSDSATVVGTFGVLSSGIHTG